ncbi:glutaminase [Balamuthia mandrillaris]
MERKDKEKEKEEEEEVKEEKEVTTGDQETAPPSAAPDRKRAFLKRTPSFDKFASSHSTSFTEVAAKYCTPSVVLCGLAADGNVEQLKELLEQTSISPDSADYDGRTALHLASEEGHLEVVKLLIEKGANINAYDRWGSTPLRGAIAHMRNDVAQYLRDKGATVQRLAKLKKQQSEHAVKQQEDLEVVKARFQELARAAGNDAGDSLPSKVLRRWLKQTHGLKSSKQHKVLNATIQKLEDSTRTIHWSKLKKICNEEEKNLLKIAMLNRLSVPDWTKFTAELVRIFEDVRSELTLPNPKANNATYIPELAREDPELFGFSVVSVDGQSFSYGDYLHDFSIQSCGKVVLYSIVHREVGAEKVHRYVGREPSGTKFNAFTLNDENKPHNPLINAGGIVACSFFPSPSGLSGRFRYLTKSVSEMAGDAKIGFSQSVYLSEKDTAYSNYALAHFMRAKNSFPEGADFLEATDFYLQMCSLEVNCETMAAIASMYANNGVSPLTGRRILAPATVKDTLQIMYSCGMYDYSGEWACTIGLPAKSGVSGCIFMVVPGVMGLAVYSPPLDKIGNSFRGIEFCERFAERFKCSILDVLFQMSFRNGEHYSSGPILETLSVDK